MSNGSIAAVEWRVREQVPNEALCTLFSKAYNIDLSLDFNPILDKSLTWLTAWRDGSLVGFINAAWDGFKHAFLVDRTALTDEPEVRNQLILTMLDTIARDHPSVDKVHLDCDPGEVSVLESRGLQQMPAGIVFL